MDKTFLKISLWNVIFMTNFFNISVEAQTSPTKIFDYSGLYSTDSGGTSKNLALPGYTPAPMLWRYDKMLEPLKLPTLPVQKTYAWQNNTNSYKALQMWDDCAPIAPIINVFSDNHCLINTMKWLSSNGFGLDYVFPDFETSADVYGNVRAVVNQIRSFPDPKIRNAKVGQYNYYPGLYNYYNNYPTLSILDRTSKGNNGDAIYRNSGATVALPALYPLSSDIVRTTSAWAAGNWIDPKTGLKSTYNLMSPNQRSALFWSSLEKLSTVKRAMTGSLSSHEIIPYISSLQWQENYPVAAGQDPTAADYSASLQHYRLRGIDGFITFIGGVFVDAKGVSHGIDYTVYRNNMLKAWRDLDFFFGLSKSVRILNLETNPTVGVEWSAMQKGNRIFGILSNLSSQTAAQAVTWSASPLPMYSPTVSKNNHIHFQYQSSFMQTETMENYDSSKTLNLQAQTWNGPSGNPSRWKVVTPAGTGNSSKKAVAAVTGAYNNTESWFKMSQSPQFLATDKVSYSAMFYYGGGGLKFYPVNTTGASATSAISWANSGPAFMISRDSKNNFQFMFRANPSADPTYQAVNSTPQVGKWYEVRMEIDPTAQSGGRGTIYIRNVTDGQRDFSLLAWNDVNTAMNERFLSLQLALNTSRNPSNFDGWAVYSLDATSQFDQFNAGYAVPDLNDNFEHDDFASLKNQGWYGPNPDGWEAKAPLYPGNSSKVAVSPRSNGYNSNVWRASQTPQFLSTDAVVYSALLNAGPKGNVGFSPVNTSKGSANLSFGDAGPYFSLRADSYAGFRVRGVQVNLNNYKATTAPIPSHWYEVQIVVDPTRSHPESVAGRYGVAKVYVRDLTANGSPILEWLANLRYR